METLSLVDVVIVTLELESVATAVALNVALLADAMELMEEILPMPVTCAGDGTAVVICLIVERSEGDGACTVRFEGCSQSR